MRDKSRSRPLFIFHLLVGYVLLQFCWWSYLMVELNNEIYHLKSELNVIKAADPQQVVIMGNELEKKLHHRWIMIAGEATVFLVLLVWGFIQTRRTFRKETALANQQKNFLLSVTHELKSPLASVKLQLETLQKRELDKNKQLEILTNALSDTERLDKLVENILLAARIDNNVFTLHREKVDLSAYIVDGMKQTIHSFNYPQQVKLDVDPVIFFSIDRTAFPSIILNLIENAVKYSPAASVITLTLKQGPAGIVLSVKDEGSGISEEEKQQIFQKFYRVGNEETRKTKGTGLGLYIVNFLVEQHNGKIAVKSNTPKGSIFEITFTK